MSYAARSRYLKLYDRKASPVYMEWIAGRYGVPGETRWLVDESSVYLDLGCAEGGNFQILAPLYPRLQFVGVDINPDHIAAAQSAKQSLGLENVDFLCADFTACEALPRAAYINVHGVYSWLSDATRRQLELELDRISLPGTLLKLHYNVNPGAQLRENIGHMFGTLGMDVSPTNARNLLDLISREAAGLKMLYSADFFDGLLKRMAERSDEIWSHDYLNADFKAEYSDVVMGRMKDVGFDFIASADMEQNIPSILAKKGISDFASGLQSASKHTFMDHVTGRGFRDDLFAKHAPDRQDFTFHKQIRLGNLWPREHMLQPFMTSQGPMDFRQPASAHIVDALMSRPLTLGELQQELTPLPFETLIFWTDMLIAATRIAPFLPATCVLDIDRQQLRNLNRQRLADAMQDFNARTSSSLLAAELGNSIDVGWFETLVLHHFHQRHEATTQRRMLESMTRANIALGDANGQRSSDQAAALRSELGRLEENYLNRLEYWGVDV